MKKERVQLVGLSKKAEEMRRLYLLGKEMPPTKKVVQMPSTGLYTSPKLPNQATPIDVGAVTPKGTYCIGDGDVLAEHRPGADDHKKYKSVESWNPVQHNPKYR